MSDEEKKEINPPQSEETPLPPAPKVKNKKKRSLFHKIVNVFLGIILGLLVIIILFIGFMQTSTFREMLRTNLLEIVNEEINGKINLEKIDGTFLTSLILRNGSLTYEKDTIAAFKDLSVKFSPFRLLFKQIAVRDVRLNDMDFRLVEDSSGVLNIAKAFPSSPDEDTTTSTFDFEIIVSNLDFRNLNFSFQKEAFVKSEASYDYFNLDDFRIDNLNLVLSAFADMEENEYELTIKEFNSKINLKRFNLNDFQGKFALSEKGIEISGFNFASDSSRLKADVKIDGINIFGDMSDDALKKVTVDLDLRSEKFNFADVASYVPALDMIKGALAVELSGKGNLSEFELRKFDIVYGETELKTTGKFYNLNDPEKLYISTLTSGSEMNFADIIKMLPGIAPEMIAKLPVMSIDTLRFAGSPTNFSTSFGMRLAQGGVRGEVVMDMDKPDMVYDVKLNTHNLDVSPILNMPSNISASIDIKGAGTDLGKMNLDSKISLNNSRIGLYNINRLFMKGDMNRGNTSIALTGDVDSAFIDFALKTDLSDMKNLPYDFSLGVNSLDLSKTMLPDLFTGRFDLYLAGRGRNFDPEDLESEISLDIRNLELRNNSLDSLDFDLTVKSEPGRAKTIDLKSTLMDFNLAGVFAYEDLAEFAGMEADSLQKRIMAKMENYFPPKEEKVENVVVNTKKINKVKLPGKEKESTQDIMMNFRAAFKEMDLISALLEFEDFSLDGKLEGSLVRNGSITAFATNLNLDFLKFKLDEEGLFVTDAKLELAAAHPTNKFDTDKLKINTELAIKRLFLGTDVKNIALQIGMENNLIKAEASADATKEISAEINAGIDISQPELVANFTNLNIDYKEFNLRNKRDFAIKYNNEKIRINDFNLYRNESEILIDGLVDPNGEQDVRINISKFKGYDVGFNVLETNPLDIIDFDLNLAAGINGTFENPLLNLNLEVNDVTYREKNFGSLAAWFDYKDKNLDTKIEFDDDKKVNAQLPLSITGNLPIDLSLGAVKDRLPKDREVNLKIFAKDFNLGSFGDAPPFIDDLKGFLSSDIVLSGTYDKLNRSGNLTLRDVSFLAEPNNLSYKAGLTVRLDEESIILENLMIENIGNVAYKGKLSGSGKIDFDGLDLVNAQMLIGGSLQVLSFDSKSTSPAVYGDLAFSTDGDVVFAMTPGKSYLKAYITITRGNLHFPPLQSSYSGSSSNFIYKYVETGKTISEREAEIQRIVAESRARTQEVFVEAKSTSTFDYDIRVRIKDEAKITFVLAEQANQKLTANLKGDLAYESIGGIQNIQGELKLLEGSTLEFLKTFTASGGIRFESDITNPYLDITATYKNYKISTEADGKEIEVAVKIKLRGTVQDLSNNFASMEDNIAVYEGTENIQNDKPSTDKEKADAIWFILTGKFTNETTSQEKQQSAGMLEGTAASLAGSLLGGVLNTYLGDYVRTLDVRSSGTATKFSLTGTVKNLRYTIGGSTNFFQDLSNANIRIEYPLIENLFIRVERRESITETNYPSEMINELGIKYRFEF